MTTPIVESVTTTAFSSASTNHNASYDSTVNAGELLLILSAIDNNPTITDPSGYTELDEQDPAVSIRASIWAKVAAGTEGGTTENIVTSSSQTGAVQIYRISGWGGTIATDIDISTVSIGADDNPDASGVTAGWGADDNLFIAMVGAGDDNESANTGPAGWTDLVTTPSGGGDNAAPSVHSARLASTNATENPGTFFITGDENWAAWTLVIKPAAASSVVPAIYNQMIRDY